MAQVTAALVKQLREMTDSPMMECKKALVEADLSLIHISEPTRP